MTTPSPDLLDQLRTARVMLANYADHDESQGHVEDAEYTRRVIKDIDATLEPYLFSSCEISG